VSDKTGIEWTRGDDGTAGATWNPVTGCVKVSPGCDHCYAETFAERWRGTPGHYFERGFDVTLRPDKLDQPLRWQRPRRIFVNSMSDLFHKDVPDEYIAQVFAIMAGCPQHTFQVLTKRHGRMSSLLRNDDFLAETGRCWLRNDGIPDDALWPGWPLPNVWLGVSVEDQHWADIRIPALIETPAAVRFLSCEPLLAQLDLGIGDPHRGHDNDDVYGWPNPRICLDCSGPEDEDEVQFFRREPDAGGIGWVIIGGESGPGARPMSERWARTLVRECQSASVPVFVKQFGSVLGRELGAGPKGGDWDMWPEDLRVREFPRVTEMTGAGRG
jgi:protein gp37